MSKTGRTFVTIASGLPRSGTSLVMQMLRAGGMTLLTDRVRPPDEDNPRGYYEFEPVKQTASDPAWLKAAQGKAVKMVFRLLVDLPPDYAYRVVLMTRKLEEVLASQRVMLARSGKPGAALDDARLATVFAGQMEKCESWLKDQPNFAVLKLNYNELLRDPLPHAARLNEFLNSGLDVEAMAGAVDPALYRQRG